MRSVALCATLIVSSETVAAARTYTITTPLDSLAADGACTLREAAAAIRSGQRSPDCLAPSATGNTIILTGDHTLATPLDLGTGTSGVTVRGQDHVITPPIAGAAFVA